MLEELWMEVCDIIQEAVSKTIPKKKKCKKANGCLRKPYNSCEKKRSKKQRRKGKIYPFAEFQRIARRDKKALLSDQCKEIEENSRIGRTRDRFKKIRDTKGTFHAKMGTRMYRNDMDLTDEEEIKKRWQECTEELCKKDLHDPDNHDGVITHLEPDILECEVKWALGSIIMNKANGGDEIPVELFQILKDNAVKVLHSYLENSAVATGLEKVSFHSHPKDRPDVFEHKEEAQ